MEYSECYVCLRRESSPAGLFKLNIKEATSIMPCITLGVPIEKDLSANLHTGCS